MTSQSSSKFTEVVSEKKMEEARDLVMGGELVKSGIATPHQLERILSMDAALKRHERAEERAAERGGLSGKANFPYYHRIESLYQIEKSRKYLFHLIAAFLPISSGLFKPASADIIKAQPECAITHRPLKCWEGTYEELLAQNPVTEEVEGEPKEDSIMLYGMASETSNRLLSLRAITSLNSWFQLYAFDASRPAVTKAVQKIAEKTNGILKF